MHRIEAIDGQLWDGIGFKQQGRSREHYWRGAAGCYFSHIKALQTAVEQNIFPCMILEDDAVLTAIPTETTGMVYLGGFVKGDDIHGTHAILYHTQQDAQKFLAYATIRKNTIDSIANNYRKANRDRVTTCASFPLATQAVDYSDIEGSVVSRSATGTIRVMTQT
jgi:hypothetical protein